MTGAFLRFLDGNLSVVIRGKGAPRFFSLCAGANIVIWGVKSEGDCCYAANILCRDFFKIYRFRRKTGVRISIRKRRGLLFVIRRGLRHRVLCVMLILAVSAAVFWHGRIWEIRIVGDSTIGEELIINYLSDKDISYGSRVKGIDPEALTLSIRQDFDNIIWADVYIDSFALVVNIKEKQDDNAADQSDAGEYTDLCALEDAEIASIVTRSGLANVKEHDVVKAGDILVGARQEILNDDGEVEEYYYKSADATILGYVTKEYEDWIDEEQVVYKKTGRSHTSFSVSFMGIRAELPKLFADYDDSGTTEDYRQLSCGINYSVIKCYELTKTNVNYSFSDAKELALSHLEQFLTDLEENGVQICDKNVIIEKIGKKYHIYGQIEVCEDIAEPVPIGKEITDEPE